MRYDDEQMLSMEGYEAMAKAYASSLRKQGFIFVQIEDNQFDEQINEIFITMSKLKSSLLFLSNFLGTGRLYSANERHIETLKLLFDFDYVCPSFRIKGDKTKCFLNTISLESKLLNLLLALSKVSTFSKRIESIVSERLSIMEELLKVPNLVTSFSQSPLV